MLCSENESLNSTNMHYTYERKKFANNMTKQSMMDIELMKKNRNLSERDRNILKLFSEEHYLKNMRVIDEAFT